MNKWNQSIISYHVIQFVSFCISYLEVTIGLWKDHLLIRTTKMPGTATQINFSTWNGPLSSPTFPSWWFQPIWKNISQIGNLPQIGEKIKNIWNHHPVSVEENKHILRWWMILNPNPLGSMGRTVYENLLIYHTKSIIHVGKTYHSHRSYLEDHPT